MQIGLVVKSVSCDLFGIGGIGLNLANGIIAKAADEVRVDSGNKDTGVSKAAKEGLAITSGAFHNGPGIAVEGEDVILKFVYSADRGSYIKGSSERDDAGCKIVTVLLPFGTSIPTAFHMIVSL